MKTLYNYSDFIMLQYANSLVNVDEPLYTDLRNATSRMLKWHRMTQLKAYSLWLDKVSNATEGPLTSVQVARYIEELDRLIFISTKQLFKELSQLMPEMKASEVEELFESLQHDNQAFYTKYVSITVKQRSEQYNKNMLKLFEDVIGEITLQQKEIIRIASSKLLHTSKERYLNRLSFQRKMKKILYADSEHIIKTKKLNTLFRDTYENSPISGNQSKNKKIVIQAISAVFESLTKKQHQQLKDTLKEYSDIFRELAIEKT